MSVRPDWDEISNAAIGRRVDAVSRRAKRVVLELDDGAAFVIEPRMTGLMLVADPPDVGHLRVEWRFSSTEREPRPIRLLFWDRRGLGTLRYYAPGEMNTALAGKLGPDALNMSPELWRAGLGRTRRAVKVAMLDQKLVAGIGNLYASEILHRARINPRTPADRIGPKRVERIHEATEATLLEAIRYEGSTLGDGTYRNALNQDGGYQNAHRVYARENQPCPACGSLIRRIVQAQRSTFFCPKCQR